VLVQLCNHHGNVLLTEYACLQNAFLAHVDSTVTFTYISVDMFVISLC